MCGPRIVQVKQKSDSALRVEYHYDGTNRRVRKITYTGDEGEEAEDTDAWYTYDGWRCIEEREDDTGWEARRQYVFGDRYLDEVLLFDKDTDDDGDCTENEGAGSTRYLYCANNNFNIMALAGATGEVAEKVLYDPYGQFCCLRVQDSHQTTLSSHFGNPWLFQGQRYVPETGLYYFKNREHSPTLGRFLQRDPLGYVDGMSLYELSKGSPVGLRDPLGLRSYYDGIGSPVKWAARKAEEQIADAAGAVADAAGAAWDGTKAAGAAWDGTKDAADSAYDAVIGDTLRGNRGT